MMMKENNPAFHNAEETAKVEKADSSFIKVDEAKAFINSCSDSIDREFLWRAFATLTFYTTSIESTGQFDVLFFVRTLAEMLKDRDDLLRVLSGRLSDE